jgi:hypothetical protein
MGHKLEARWTTEAASETFESRTETIDHTTDPSGHPLSATLASSRTRTARFAEQATFGFRPFRAFTIGALIHVPLGHALSAIVLADPRARI